MQTRGLGCVSTLPASLNSIYLEAQCWTAAPGQGHSRRGSRASFPLALMLTDCVVHTSSTTERTSARCCGRFNVSSVRAGSDRSKPKERNNIQSIFKLKLVSKSNAAIDERDVKCGCFYMLASIQTREVNTQRGSGVSRHTQTQTHTQTVTDIHSWVNRRTWTNSGSCPEPAMKKNSSQEARGSLCGVSRCKRARHRRARDMGEGIVTAQTGRAMTESHWLLKNQETQTGGLAADRQFFRSV